MTINRRAFMAAMGGLVAPGLCQFQQEKGDGFRPCQEVIYANVPWALHENATPLRDFCGVAMDHKLSPSVFDCRSIVVMSRCAFNAIRCNTNLLDIYGRRSACSWGGRMNLQYVNQIMAGEDLPQIVIVLDMDQATGFLGSAEVVFVGRRDGLPDPTPESYLNYDLVRMRIAPRHLYA
jgi:hypothetical protein